MNYFEAGAELVIGLLLMMAGAMSVLAVLAACIFFVYLIILMADGIYRAIRE